MVSVGDGLEANDTFARPVKKRSVTGWEGHGGPRRHTVGDGLARPVKKRSGVTRDKHNGRRRYPGAIREWPAGIGLFTT